MHLNLKEKIRLLLIVNLKRNEIRSHLKRMRKRKQKTFHSPEDLDKMLNLLDKNWKRFGKNVDPPEARTGKDFGNAFLGPSDARFKQDVDPPEGRNGKDFGKAFLGPPEARFGQDFDLPEARNGKDFGKPFLDPPEARFGNMLNLLR